MKQKTVGILTFHRALNYGAVLQAYALKKVCDDLGCDAHIIDYDYDGGEELATPVAAFLAAKNKKAALPGLIRNLLGWPGTRKRAGAFASFRREYLAESAPCKTAEEITALGYDALIAGSDQIWNRGVTQHRYDPVFFMDFDTSAGQILYAASSEDVPFHGEKGEAFARALEGLQGTVSIREKKLADYVQSLTGKTYPVVLDPTLLAGRAFLDTIAIPEPPAGEYILLYQIDSNPASDISVRTLEERFGCPVYTMTVPRLDDSHGRRGTAGPEEFLSLLKGTRFLVTNSFHGIALSLLMHKQFFVYENGGVMSRIDSLLDLAGLENRKVKLVADIDPDFAVEYGNVDARLEDARADSMAFVHQALNVPSSVPTSPRRQKADCSGCTACMEVCPVGAIRMEADEEGFLYPEIDDEKCIRCGKCDQVCAFRRFPKREEPFGLPQAFGVKHTDLPVRQSSRSGAAFVGFSDVILRRGGVVYGASMGEDFVVRHIRAVTAQERDRMKGAKYVQSDIRGIYPQVAQDLKNGLDVLFSGTPCQVAGLRGYLRETHVDTAKLVCCNLACHGVPSPAIWSDYVHLIEQSHGGRLSATNFRDKRFGWEAHWETYHLDNMKKPLVSNDFTNLYFQHLMLRPSCSVCPLADISRPGDLTLADFWGIDEQTPAFNDNLGVSLVLVNSPAGAELMEAADANFNCFQTSIRDCMQPAFSKPNPASPRRAQFWRDYQQMPFADLLRKYTTPTSAPARTKKLVKKLLYRLGLRQHP